MKMICFITIIVLFFCNCDGLSPEKSVEQSLVGVYTYYGKNEVSEANDTLNISVYNEQAETFKIVKSTGFNRFIDGNKLPREYKVQTMLAVYDAKKMLLQDLKTGKIFSFTPGKKELLYGSASYQKIK